MAVHFNTVGSVQRSRALVMQKYPGNWRASARLVHELSREAVCCSRSEPADFYHSSVPTALTTRCLQGCPQSAAPKCSPASELKADAAFAQNNPRVKARALKYWCPSWCSGEWCNPPLHTQLDQTGPHPARHGAFSSRVAASIAEEPCYTLGARGSLSCHGIWTLCGVCSPPSAQPRSGSSVSRGTRTILHGISLPFGP